MDELSDDAAANNKGFSENAAKVGQGAAEVGKGAADATKSAMDAGRQAADGADDKRARALRSCAERCA